MPEAIILGGSNVCWFGPPAPLCLRYLLPDGSPLPKDLVLQHSPSYYRLQRRTFRNPEEALACAASV